MNGSAGSSRETMPSAERTRWIRSSPEPSGSRTSTTATSGQANSSRPTAASTESVTSNSYPSAVRLSARKVRTTGSSSTSRIVAACMAPIGAAAKNYSAHGANRQPDAGRRRDLAGRDLLAAQAHVGLAADGSGDDVGGGEPAAERPAEVALAPRHAADVGGGALELGR